METLYPAEAQDPVPVLAGAPVPDLTDPGAARAWLEARTHYQRAHRGYADLGVPEAEEILEHLDALARLSEPEPAR